MKINAVIYHAPNYISPRGSMGKVGCTINLPRRQRQYGQNVKMIVLERLSGVTKDEADQLVADAIGTVRTAGVDAKGEVCGGFTGRVPEGIVQVAKDQDCDLIVMGSRGLSDVAGAFLGSVTHGVIHLADAAVLVARSHHTPEVTKVGAKAIGAAS